MPTVRGFVQQIEVGRAGLVRVSLVHADGTSGTYVIRDLDADPERFNERLSKLGILRDAMNRAEPVEIEHVPGEAGAEIDRAARITRDALAPIGKVEQVAGLVVDVLVHAENGVDATGERHDRADISLLATDLKPRGFVLDLQAPERLVVNAQLEMLRDAQSRGRVVRLIVGVGAGVTPRIVAVAVDNASGTFGDRQVDEVSGFVETLSLLRLPFPGAAGAASNFAHVGFTTAPPFTGAGNTIGTSPFTPATIDLLVVRGSLAYDLFEAGLRDNLRMRVEAASLQDGRKPDVDAAEVKGEAVAAGRVRTLFGMTAGGKGEGEVALVLGAEILAPLASASRPVWITIARQSLDHGPDGPSCTTGVPSSDLTPRGLRDLRIPYPAVWRGMACFNPGVYRFQLALPSPFKLLVDGRELCLYHSDTAGIMLAYACLERHHEVTVEIEAWTCDDEFVMDLYRVR